MMVHHGVSGIKTIAAGPARLSSLRSSSLQSAHTPAYVKQPAPVIPAKLTRTTKSTGVCPDVAASSTTTAAAPASTINRSSLSSMLAKTRLALFNALTCSGWQQFRQSSLYLPGFYILLVSTLTGAALFIYSQFIDLTFINAQVVSQIIFIFLWSSVVAGAMMLLGSLKAWQIQQRHTALKPIALTLWDQLDALQALLSRVQSVCQSTDKPACAALMKCLDHYYEQSVSTNKDLQKIKLFLNHQKFDQLLADYDSTSKEFRDKLSDLIGLLTGQPYEQQSCKAVLQRLAPLCSRIDQYHQAICQQLIGIIRY